MPTRAANVFTIAPGAPFLPTLSRAFLDGALIPGFPGAGGPLTLATATIYVPTQRAGAALAQALVAAGGGTSLILPRIAPLGAIEPDEAAGSASGDGEDGPAADLPPAVGELTRRLTLARLIRAWSLALRGAIRRMGPDGGLEFDDREPPLVATSPAQAVALAGDLAALIDDMTIEGVAWERLQGLAPDAFDAYWGVTLEFLKIATARWPDWLAEKGLIDRARRVTLLVEAEAAALTGESARGPTVIAGSTGANRATARLIAAIARAPQGAVVLPGLDLDLDEAAWDLVGAGGDGSSGVAGHPQALLHRLLATIGVARREVRALGAPTPALRARGSFLSEALRPADSTEAWRARGGALAERPVATALADVAILVAESENEEALALAVAMREALETPGKTAALITPDPSIARRVSAELARWGVEVEDSAGRTLGQTPAGALARLALAAAVDFAPQPLLALTAHPALRLAQARAEIESAARALELGVLRAGLAAALLDEPAKLFAAARRLADERHAHPTVRRLSDEDWRAAADLLAGLAGALAPLRALEADAPLDAFVAAHRAALEALCAPDGVAAAEGGAALESLMAEWTEASRESFSCALADYAGLFEDALARQRAPLRQAGHPRLKILGLLEARLLDFDRALLAGLDEKTWPPAAETDAFLNRPMRAALGLAPPERRIGQTAHDFLAALGASEVVVSRAKKRGGEPTVASRFLQRIGAAAGKTALEAAEARGRRYLRLARGLDAAGPWLALKRPEPRPAAELRPKRLSVTRIEALRRDPYAIYAEYVLELLPLPPVGEVGDAREIGIAWHAALQRFVEDHPAGPLPTDAKARLEALTRQAFAPMLADPAFRALRWPAVLAGLDFFLAYERDARPSMARSLVEQGGRLDVDLGEGRAFALTARADRIDLVTDGGARILDYKTGAPPGLDEVRVGFAPQLTLEAAMLARGGFPALRGVTAQGALYLKLGGAGGGAIRNLRFKDEPFAEVVERHFAFFIGLVAQFADPQTPYLSRPFPKFLARSDDYDHLARVREWSATGGGEAGGAP